MKARGLNRNVLAIYIASFFSYQMYIPSLLLASLYAWYPNVDPNAVILMYSAPMLVSALLAFVVGAIMSKVNKKMMLLVGMGSIVLAGCLIVFTGGNSFPIALAGAILTGVGYSIIINVTNALLVVVSPPGTASKAVAINAAVGCVGSMIITYVAGILASGGNWTHAYYLCFPVVILMIAVAVLYQNKETEVQTDQSSAAATTASGGNGTEYRNIGLFSMIILIFILANFGNTAWNANSASYIVDVAKMGTTVETGTLSSLNSFGGVIGGFVFAGIAIKYMKKLVVPVCLLFTMLPRLAAVFGINNMIVFYICGFLFMMCFQPVYGVMVSSAGKQLPGGLGTSIVSGVMGFAGFVAPYVINFIAGFMGGSILSRLWVGITCTLIAVIISVPVMRKAQA